MSTGPIPASVVLARLVGDESRFEGVIEACGLPRLAEIGQLRDGVQADVLIERLRHGESRLHIVARAAVDMTCQRCLGTVTIELDVDSALGIVPEVVPTGGPSGETEVAVAETGVLRLFERIEDELLLAVPAVPRHPEGECEPAARTASPEGSEGMPEKENPFAVLASLKRGGNQHES